MPRIPVSPSSIGTLLDHGVGFLDSLISLIEPAEKTMAKPSINAKAVLKDIKSGMSKADLMEKYKLSPKGLESLYKKLVEAGLIQTGKGGSGPGAADATQKRRASRPAQTSPKPSPAEPTTRPKQGAGASRPRPKPKPAAPQVSELAEAVAEDINAGMHDNQILQRHEISPGQFREIKEELVQAGLLMPADTPAGSAIRKATRSCPSCGNAVPEKAAKCNHCGEWLDDLATYGPEDRGGEPRAEQSMPPPGAGPGAADDDWDDLEPDEDCPWEERESYGTLSAFFQTATKCLLTPTVFFSRLPLNAGFFNPLLFAVFSVVISTAVGYVLSQLLTGYGGFVGLIFSLIFAFIAALLIIPVALFIWSGILHLCLLLVGGARNGFEATFRVVSYSSVTGVFNAIPVVGIVLSLWGTVLTVIGLRETHKTSTGKAVAAVAIPVIIGVIIGLVAFFSMMSMVKTAFSEAASTTEMSGAAIPAEVCTAIEEYITDIDFAKDAGDAKATQEQMQQAMQALNETLDDFKNHPDINEIRKLAMVYGLAVLAQTQVSSAMKGLAPDLGAADEHRERLSSLCGR
jgi:hypothetical protein